MSFIRIRLTFQRPLPLKEVKNCWFLVDTSICNTIADLEYLIKKRFIAILKSCSSVDLFLEDYLLPSQEKIEIIQNNDNIRVEVKQMIIKQASREEDCDDQEKVKRRKQDKSVLNASNKSKRKQVGNSEEALNERKKKRTEPPENGVQDVNSSERHNKSRKGKLSSKDSKNPVKEPKMAKQVHEKHKPNLSTHAVTKKNNVESLAQEGRKSTKAFALTSTVNNQLNKSSKPSKEKSNMADKPDYPSQRFSSKANIGKRKSNLEPVKTNSKKIKSNTNGKGKDLGKKIVNGIVTGKRNADGDASSSESSIESSSSSSTESSSESTDESGPSNSHPKVNGTVSPVASAKLVNNNYKSPLHERLGKDVQRKIANDSSAGKTGKDETGVPLKIHTNSKGNGAMRESSSSSDSSTDTGKSADAVRKDARSSSPSSSSSSSSSESEEKEPKLDKNKETSSSLLHPLLSSPSSQSFPSPSLLRGIQMQDTNETSVKQSPIHSVKEKISQFGQKQAQQSTSKRPNNKPDSCNSTSHIRFDSEESGEETFEEQQEVACSMKAIADDLNSTPPSSNIAASEQNHQASLKIAPSECKEPVQRDYSLCTPLHGPPRSRDRIAYKVLELSASYTPEVSSYKEAGNSFQPFCSSYTLKDEYYHCSTSDATIMEGTVVNFDSSSGAITIELSKESLKKTRGDGNITGKFELVYDESEENTDNMEEDPEVIVSWNSMIDPVLIE